MSYCYVLDDNGEPRETDDIAAWGAFMQDVTNRRIERTDISTDVFVSTVFLGVDHDHAQVGPPVLYETLVFGSSLDGEMERYRTRQQAIVGHAEMVERVRRAEAG